MTTLGTMVINMVNKGNAALQTIQASEFKAKCLALMDDVARTGEVWVVTKNGRPIAELRPYSGKRHGSPFGLHPKLEITGDIVSPIDDVEWKVLV
jgi:prevent-host-death family protein